MNLRQLVESKALYLDPGKKPRTFALMAERCGISRQHLYTLFSGLQSPPAHTVVKIARGLKVTVEDVEKALSVTWTENEA